MQDHASAIPVLRNTFCITAVRRCACCPCRLCTRPSMEKFEAPHPKLEVIRPAGYMAAYLNRQIVQLLFTLGVGDSVFLDMQVGIASNNSAIISWFTRMSRDGAPCFFARHA